MGESGEPIGMRGDRVADYVVHVVRQTDALGAIEQIGAGPRCGENLHRNARLIHVGEPSSAKVEQRLFQAIVELKRKSALDDRLRIDPLGQAGKQVMFRRATTRMADLPPKLLSIVEAVIDS